MYLNGEPIKTLWYCLKTYNRDKVRFIAMEYADHNRSWFDPTFICKSEEACRLRCDELNKAANT